MIKRIFFYFLSVVLFCLIFIFLAEILLRVFRGSPNPLSDITQKHSSFLFQPDTEFENRSSKEGEFKYQVHINHFGFRGPDFRKEKSAGVKRIMFVGDSFTFGVGAQENETIPERIAQRLKVKNISAEVINAGIGHASPVSHYVNLRDHHLKYKPDVVLVLLDLTDLWDDWHTERNAVLDEKGEIIRFDPQYIDGKRDWWVTATHSSAFCKYVNDKILRTFKKIGELGWKRYFTAVIQGKRAKAVIVNSRDQVSKNAQIEYDGLLMLRGREKKDLIDEHWPRTAKYLSKIHGLLKEHDIPMILVMYPHGIYVGAREWSKGRETWGFEANKRYTDYYPFELGKEYARKEGVPFINALDNFPVSDGQTYFYDWDGHMTPAGYATVAEAISENPQFLKFFK